LAKDNADGLGFVAIGVEDVAVIYDDHLLDDAACV
jgi:hypothetical protein